MLAEAAQTFTEKDTVIDQLKKDVEAGERQNAMQVNCL